VEEPVTSTTDTQAPFDSAKAEALANVFLRSDLPIGDEPISPRLSQGFPHKYPTR